MQENLKSHQVGNTIHVRYNGVQQPTAEAARAADAESAMSSTSESPEPKVMVNVVDNSCSYEEHRQRKLEEAKATDAESAMSSTSESPEPKVMVNVVDNSCSYEEHQRDLAFAAIQPTAEAQTTGTGTAQTAAPGMQNTIPPAGSVGYDPLQMCANAQVYYDYHNLMEANGFSSSSDGWLQYEGKALMNCTVSIDQTVEGERRSFYRCSVQLNGERFRRDIAVKLFSEGKWLLELAGFVLRGEKKDLKRYLNLVIMRDGMLDRTIERDEPGWCSVNGAPLYATVAGSISATGTVPVTSVKGQRFINYADHRIGTLNAFFEMMKLTPRSWVAAMLLLHTVVGFLYTLFRQAGWLPRFVLFLLGATGAMKSSLASAVTQLENTINPKHPLSSTLAALEGAYSEYKDAVALFDDLKPGSDRSEQNGLKRNLEAIIRAYGDANGRQRNRDFQPSLGQYEAEGGAVITGEFLPCHGSSLSRLLVLPLARGDVNAELLSYVQQRPRLAPFMYSFLSFVAANYNEMVQFIAACGNAHRRDLLPCRFAHDRYRYDQVILMTAIDVLVKYGKDTGQWTPAMDVVIQYLRSCVVQCIKYNMDLYLADQPETVLCKAIDEGIASGTPEMVPVYTSVEAKRQAVFSDQNSIYVLPSTVLDWYDRYVAANGLSRPKYSTTEIGNMLLSCGALWQVQEGKTLRKAARYPGCGTKRYFKLNKAVLIRIAEGHD